MNKIIDMLCSVAFIITMMIGMMVAIFGVCKIGIFIMVIGLIERIVVECYEWRKRA